LSALNLLQARESQREREREATQDQSPNYESCVRCRECAVGSYETISPFSMFHLMT
jgi:hypothetical protein